jgi:radical SAM enzyme (TIGR01210 family)
MSAESTPERIDVQNVDIDYSYLNTIYDPTFGRPVSRWTILLPGSGCEWARKKHKGCSFCAFNAKIDEITGGRLLPHDEMMEVFEYAKTKTAGASPELLALFNGGNYINDKEIVASAQISMLEYAATHPTIKTILFESKTEYLSARKLDACLKAAKNKKLRIAIGLETKDDYLRNTVINKGMSKEAYERSIKRLHELGIEVQSYVFMKPYTLNERQAIEEAVQTIEYAVECGSDIIMLEAAMVQKGTAFEEAYNKGEFDSPKLWSLREVVDRTKQYPQLNVGIFDEEPKPISYPKNCPKCTDQFNKAFHVFRETHDIKPLLGLDCSCRSDWFKEVNPAKT